MMFRRIIQIILCCLLYVPLQAIPSSWVGSDSLFHQPGLNSPSARTASVIESALQHYSTPGTAVRILPHAGENRTLPFLLALALLFIVALLKLVYARYFHNLMGIFTSFQISKRQMREQLDMDARASVWFTLLFFLSLAFVLFQIIPAGQIHPWLQHPLKGYLFCLLLSVLVWSLRFLLLWLFAWIFDGRDEVKPYIFSTRLSNEFLGMVWTPICLILICGPEPFKKPFIMLALFCGLAILLFNYITNLKRLRNMFGASFVHFLLYLCAFEILPVAVLVKMFRYGF
ncbi:MAG TPA: DUF4271 domain-containing protein [Chitinophagaceae bacterium]|nr:DUF4271 domain-containing protein [Chitinophagaceae bacterium]HNF71507.1 DUF4271 domain-containing protein [Chitinophagaceae bacterium]